MKTDIVPSLFNYLSNNSVHSLQAIQYMFFLFVSLFNSEKKDNSNNLANKIHSLYQETNQNVDFDLKEITENIFEITNLNNIDQVTLLNDIFDYYLNNENLSVIKEYVKFYNKKQLTDWIVKLANPKINEESIFDGNIKINSYLESIINSSEIKIKNKLKGFYGHQSNKIINGLFITNFKLNYKQDISTNITPEDLLLNDIKLPIGTFDLIFYDFPSDIHNITHASCCKKIKKLKIRGTKSEPLILQLIMGSLNKKGRAVLVVPDSLLHSDSNLQVITRKYLVENFNVKKIIKIDESLFMGKGIKNSILYFENNGKTTNIEISKIFPSNNEIKEESIMNISIESIKKNIFSLHFKDHESLNNNISADIKYESIDKLCQIETDFNQLKNKNVVLAITKTYKNDNSIQLIKDCSDLNNFEFFIGNKDQSNPYILFYLEHIFKTKYQQLVKGKTEQFNLEKINQIQIPLLTESVQKSLCNYFDITNNLVKSNYEKIKNVQTLRDCVLDSVSKNNMVKIKDICNLTVSETNSTKLIGIIRNGLSAGTVYQANSGQNLSMNSHYLVIKNEEYLFDYVYHMLKFNEPKLKTIANFNDQPNLGQTNLLEFEINSINLQNQQEVTSYCNDFDSTINQCTINIQSMKEKDIMGTILKLNGIN